MTTGFTDCNSAIVRMSASSYLSFKVDHVCVSNVLPAVVWQSDLHSSLSQWWRPSCSPQLYLQHRPPSFSSLRPWQLLLQQPQHNIGGGLNSYYCVVHSFFNFLVLRLEHSVFEIIFTATHVNNGIPRLGPCGFALVQEQVMPLAPWNFCSKWDDVCDANYWQQDRLDIHQVQGRPCVIRPMEIRGVLCYESARVGDVVFVKCWTEGMGNCIQSSFYVPLPC